MIRIGFVGAGFMGQLAHIRSYARLRDECELVALAEPRVRTADLVAAGYGIGRVYRDHRELLEAEQVDALVVSQPFQYHGALLPEIYPAVRYLFTEKPLALHPSTGDRLARLAQEAGCVHMVGCHRRSDPATREAKRILDGWRESGEMGALRYARVCYPDGDWLAGAQSSLLDAGDEQPALPLEEPPAELTSGDGPAALFIGANDLVHPVNLLRHLIGERLRVVFAHASGRLYAFEGDSGVPATLEVDPYRVTVGFEEEILVAFERGYVRLRPAPALAVDRAGTLEVYRDPGVDAAPERVTPGLPPIDPMQAQAADFLRVCRGEALPPTDVTQAAEDLRLVTEMTQMRLEGAGAHEALRRELADRARAWEEQLSTMDEGARTYLSRARRGRVRARRRR